MKANTVLSKSQSFHEFFTKEMRLCLQVFAFLTVILVTVLHSAPAVWNGTADTSWYGGAAQAYNLTTAEQVAGLALLVNNGSSNFQGKTITLGADIFLNDTAGYGAGIWGSISHRNWTPIGTSTRPFKGEFDGLAGAQNRKIYGLYINNPSDGQGFFGYTNGVNISNLDLLIGQVTANNDVGSLIGKAVDGTVFNVQSTVVVGGKSRVGGLIGNTSGVINKSIHYDNVTGQDSVGGLVGITTANVSNSSAEGNISGATYVGGLLGLAVGSTVSTSFARGNITGTGNYVGGLIGTSGAVVSSSYAVGNVKGASHIGGLIGSASGSISSSHAAGGIEGISHIGGLIGSASGNISSSHAVGNVTGTMDYVGGLLGYASSHLVTGIASDTGYTTYSKGRVSGRDYVGGLIGQFYYSSSAKDSVMNAYSIGDVSGVGYVGGLIGYSKGYNASYTKNMRNVYAQGSIMGTGNNIGGLAGYVMNGSIISANHTQGNVQGQDSVGGLVGYANSRSILGVASDTGYTTFSKGRVSGRNYVGGLVGRLYYSSSVKDSVTNVYSIGDVSGTDYIGGLIGYSQGYSSSYTRQINNAYSQGKITGTNNYIGGIAGYVLYGTIILANHANGFVTGSGNYVGGIAGYMSGIITSSYSDGLVVGQDTIGGLVGFVNGAVRDAYALKTVKGRNMVGGLIGYTSAAVDVSYFTGDSVTGVFQVGGLIGQNTGTVTIDSSYSAAHVKGDDNVGGLIGSSAGTISNSYALGNVVGDVENSSAGNDNIGGLVGYAHSGNISQSFALGNVSGTTKLGGLVGRFDGTSLNQTYANGNVTGLFYGNPQDSIGSYYIGGLIGYGKGILNESYSSGVVKGNVYTGCLVGFVNGLMTVSSTYYNGESCGQSVVDGSETITANSKTTEEMQTPGTFMDWDFINTWKIYNSSYPYLHFFANSLANAVVQTSSLEGFEYDTTAKTPTVTSVTLFGNALTLSSNYTVTYKNNVNAGEATIEVCGVGLYNGCKKITFTIQPIAITPTITEIENVTYNGQEQKPEISVYEGENLIHSNEYTIEYEDNINSGTAKISIMMTGNYSGTASKTFTITKAEAIVTESPMASEITYGSELSASTLSGGLANTAGTFSWETPSTAPTISNSGYTVTFTPTDTNYLTPSSITIPIIVNKANGIFPMIPVLSTIYNTSLKLSDIELPENYVWESPSTALNAGDMQNFSVIYTDPSGNYNPVNGMVTVNVAKADIFPTIALANWAYGETANDPSVSGNTENGIITYLYSASPIGDFNTTPPINAGVYFVTASIGETINYNAAFTDTIEFNILKSSGTFVSISAIDIWHSMGLTLSNISLPSDYVWGFPETDLSIGLNQQFAVIYTDPSENYESIDGLVTLNIKGIPTIIDLPTASDIVYGESLLNSELSGGSANVPGTFSWETPIIKPTVINNGYSVIFTPNDSETYSTTSVIVPVTVAKAIIIATADNKTKIFGEVNPEFSISYSGFVNGEDASVLTTVPTANTTATTSSDVDHYNITVSGGVADNYSFSYVNGLLTVNKVTGTFPSISDLSTTYNPTLKLSDIELPENYVWDFPEILVNAGETQQFSAIYTDPSGNYNSVSGMIIVNVAKADIYPTISPANRIYGQAASYPTINGNMENGGIAYFYSKSPTENFDQTKPIDAGIYYVTAIINGTANYNTATTDTVQFIISKASLTVTASNKSKLYGDANPKLTVSYNGFVNGEDASVLKTVPTAITTATTSSGVGTYDIRVSGATSKNYVISHMAGTLTIDQAILTVMADSKTKTYGEVNPELTVSYSGFVNGENASALIVIPTARTMATVGSDIGDYNITVSGGVSNNYSFSYANGTLMITKATGIFPTISPLSATYNTTLKLSDIELPENYNWNFPGILINAGNNQKFSATYTDPSENYNSISGMITINVAKANIYPIISLADWVYGEIESEPFVNGNLGWGTVTYLYSTSPEGNFTSAKPIDAGTYYVKAIIAATTNYNEATTDAVKFLIESSSSVIPQFTSGVRQSDPVYYDLKGTPLGSSKPKTAGIYIVKIGKTTKRVVVK